MDGKVLALNKNLTEMMSRIKEVLEPTPEEVLAESEPQIH